MNILPSSDVKSLTATQYLNDDNGGTRLFFTDTSDKLYYFLMRNDEVIVNGVMQGYFMNGTYNYRYDFDKHIRIENQEEPIFTSLDTEGGIKFEANTDCKLYLYLGTSNILETNITNNILVVQNNGNIIFAQYKNNSHIVANTKVTPTFKDAKIGSPFKLPIVMATEHYIPITLTPNTGINYTYKNKNGGTLYSYSASNNTNNKLLILMLKPPVGTASIVMGFVSGSTQTITTKLVDGCNMTPYYFWNIDGGYDVLYCSGVANETHNVSKKYLNINGAQKAYSIETEISITQNTGFGITQDQIYSLIKAPQVNLIKAEGDIKSKFYNIDTTSFDGFNGKNLSQKNLQLSFSLPMLKKRYTNNQINFFD